MTLAATAGSCRPALSMWQSSLSPADVDVSPPRDNPGTSAKNSVTLRNLPELYLPTARLTWRTTHLAAQQTLDAPPLPANRGQLGLNLTRQRVPGCMPSPLPSDYTMRMLKCRPSTRPSLNAANASPALRLRPQWARKSLETEAGMGWACKSAPHPGSFSMECRSSGCYWP